MLDYDLAQTACDAAVDFDFLRQQSDQRFGGVEKLVVALRDTFNKDVTEIGTVLTGPDVIIMNEVLAFMHFDKCTTVSDVVTNVVRIVDEIEAAWAIKRYDEKLANFCLVLSKVASARLCGSGQSMVIGRPLLDHTIEEKDHGERNNEESGEVTQQDRDNQLSSGGDWLT